jgi:hypothetical protein
MHIWLLNDENQIFTEIMTISVSELGHFQQYFQYLFCKIN